MKNLVICILGLFLYSCNLDIVENYYSDHQDIIEDKFTGNGFVPNSFLINSIKDVRTIHNIDINEHLIKLRYTDSIDFYNLINNFDSCEIVFTAPNSFDLPKWWDMDNNEIIKCCYFDNENIRYRLGVDTKLKIIFSW